MGRIANGNFVKIKTEISHKTNEILNEYMNTRKRISPKEKISKSDIISECLEIAVPGIIQQIKHLKK